MVELFKRKKSKFWYFQCDIEGKRRRISTKCTNEKLAKKKMQELVEEMKSRACDYTEDVPIEPFKVRYFDYSKTHKSHGTYLLDRGIINSFLDRVAEYLGKSKYTLSDVTVKHLERYFQELKATGLTEKTMNNYIIQLRAMFTKAIKWKYINENPGLQIEKYTIEDAQLPKYMTKEELAKFLKHCSPYLKTIIVFLAYTGMRIGELANLKWNNIDFLHNNIKIEKKQGWKPKTRKARSIPIHNKVLAILKKIKAKSKSEYVFTSPEGGKFCKDNVRKRYLKKAAKKANLKWVGYHSCRHTFSVYFLLAQNDFYALSKILGHSSIKTTMIYADVVPGHLHKTINKLDLI